MSQIYLFIVSQISLNSLLVIFFLAESRRVWQAFDMVFLHLLQTALKCSAEVFGTRDLTTAFIYSIFSSSNGISVAVWPFLVFHLSCSVGEYPGQK